MSNVSREQAAAYCKDIQKVEGYQAWIIGIVEKGNRYVDHNHCLWKGRYFKDLVLNKDLFGILGP